ncbi:MAG: 16S rRNA (guanine(966)-N(2))-methyltransferase RsmD [Coleofasciculaceae cyanobacterium RL_1_1]|nr:16S rRNA (guanine(966)-N(2))-methyltransferase RsmD [Coleofasciculaceae cyanobacterium RL_1_1]
MSIRIYGNRAIATLPGDRTRPTPSRVRESLFDIWRGKIAGSRWLDICAGSGSMGAEALCRGVTSAVAIEQFGRACQIIETNWQKVKRDEQTIRVLRGDAKRSLAMLAGASFDLIYFDPPYASSLYQPVLEAIVQFDLLTDDGEIAVEHDRDRDDIPLQTIPLTSTDSHPKPDRSSSKRLESHRTKVYGRTAISFFRYAHH